MSPAMFTLLIVSAAMSVIALPAVKVQQAMQPVEQKHALQSVGITHEGEFHQSQQGKAGAKSIMRSGHEDVQAVEGDGEISGAGELAQTDSEFLPALGLSNPSDLAYRAMDMMLGIASIIPEDYPFVCICGNTGTCMENLPEDKKTPCPSRIGQKAAATRAPLGVVAFFAVATALGMGA